MAQNQSNPIQHIEPSTSKFVSNSTAAALNHHDQHGFLDHHGHHDYLDPNNHDHHDHHQAKKCISLSHGDEKAMEIK